MAHPDYSSDDSNEGRHSRSPSPPAHRDAASSGHSRRRRDSRSPPPRSRRRVDSTDPADRERELADQLRRRALASKEAASARTLKRKVSPSSSRSRSQSRSRSRTPPSLHSSASPPPRQASRRSTSLPRPASPSPPREHSSTTTRRKARNDDRERDRRRRRSGRDDVPDGYQDERHQGDEDAYARPNSRPRDDGSTSSRRREDRRASLTRARDIDEEDVRSHRSGHSRHTASREPEPYGRYDRDARHRRGPPPRHDPWGHDEPHSRAPRYDQDYYSAPYSRGGRDRYDYDRRRLHRRSPSVPIRKEPTPDPEDYELRSVFCSQLAVRLTQRDLGEFFEEKLGENTVQDVRIVTDRVTGRSKGIAYVELTSEELVPKAIACSGEVLFGIPILVQVTDAARNRGEGASTAQAPIRPNMPENGLPKIDPNSLSKLPLPPHLAALAGNAIHLGGGAGRDNKVTNTAARLYVGSLHFNLVDTDVRAVFEPFGDIESVDLHREPDGKSKGFAFVQYKKAEDAEKAIEHMNGFELAGRNIRVGHVNSRGQDNNAARAAPTTQSDPNGNGGGNTATVTSSFDEGGGGGLNAYSRANLMQMLARNSSGAEAGASNGSPVAPTEQVRPASIPQGTSKAVLLKNMFNPAEETEANWDLDLSADVKEECESKYGKVQECHVDKESTSGDIYMSFEEISGATKAIAGLNGRWFGGRQVAAGFISESFLKARLN